MTKNSKAQFHKIKLGMNYKKKQPQNPAFLSYIASDESNHYKSIYR